MNALGFDPGSLRSSHQRVNHMTTPAALEVNIQENLNCSMNWEMPFAKAAYMCDMRTVK